MNPLARTRRGIVPFVVLALIAAFMSGGCTVVPRTEFDAYRETFNEVSQSAQELYLDFAPVAKRYRDADATAAAKKLALSQLDAKLAAPLQPPGASFVESRIRALKLVEDYNTILAQVVSESSEPEAGAAVTNLLTSIKDFPFAALDISAKGVVDAAGDAIPFIKLAEPVIAAVEREVKAQRFKAGLLQGAPLIRDLITLLKADAEDMKDVRIADLKNEDVGDLLPLLGDASRKLESLVTSAAPTPAGTKDAGATVGRANEARGKVGSLSSPEPITSDGIRKLTPDEATAAQELANQIVHISGQIVAAEDRMLAYHETMTNYRALLDRLEDRRATLAYAAEHHARQLPPVGDLVRAYIDLRRAYAEYEKTR